MKYKITFKQRQFIIDAENEIEAVKKAEENINNELSQEEEKAIEDYRNAIKNTKDIKLLKLYAHILQEEIEHLEELNNDKANDIE